MNMPSKTKLVFITHSELTQRYLDNFYMDKLEATFDFEYWDCSNLFKPGFHYDNSLERPYVVKILDERDLRYNLKRIPKDSVITLFSMLTKDNYRYLKIISQYFHKICRIRVWAVFSNNSNKNSLSSTESNIKNGSKLRDYKKLLIEVKKRLYKISIIKKIIKAVSNRVNVENRIYALFEWYDMYPSPECKYYVNDANVDKYIKYKNQDKNFERFIVYIDSYFPYHAELKLNDKSWNAEKRAETHYKKINNFFDAIETKYGCPIIIAAHPQAKYVQNPFHGRRILWYKTDELVLNSVGVLMHNSSSITYAILDRKPIALILDDEYKQSPWLNPVMALHTQYGLNLIEIEKVHNNADIELLPITDIKRQEYINTFIGAEPDSSKFRSNDQLLIENFTKVHDDMYGMNK